MDVLGGRSHWNLLLWPHHLFDLIPCCCIWFHLLLCHTGKYQIGHHVLQNLKYNRKFYRVSIAFTYVEFLTYKKFYVEKLYFVCSFSYIPKKIKNFSYAYSILFTCFVWAHFPWIKSCSFDISALRIRSVRRWFARNVHRLNRQGLDFGPLLT